MLSSVGSIFLLRHRLLSRASSLLHRAQSSQSLKPQLSHVTFGTSASTQCLLISLQSILFPTPFAQIFLLLHPSRATSLNWSRLSALIFASPLMYIPAQPSSASQGRLETKYASSKHTRTSLMTSRRERLQDWTKLPREKCFWFSRTGNLAI